MTELQRLIADLQTWSTNDLAELVRNCNEDGFPLLVKAARKVLVSRVRVVIEPQKQMGRSLVGDGLDRL